MIKSKYSEISYFSSEAAPPAMITSHQELMSFTGILKNRVRFNKMIEVYVFSKKNNRKLGNTQFLNTDIMQTKCIGRIEDKYIAWRLKFIDLRSIDSNNKWFLQVQQQSE